VAVRNIFFIDDRVQDKEALFSDIAPLGLADRGDPNVIVNRHNNHLIAETGNQFQ